MKGKKIAWTLSVLLFESISAQVLDWPKSFPREKGINVVTLDTVAHRGQGYYLELCQLLVEELNIPISLDTIGLRLVFMSKRQQEVFADRNRDGGLSDKPDWTGSFVPPALIIILSTEESDGTFLHEFLHYLHSQKVILKNIPEEMTEMLVRGIEGMLLGSDRYLKLIKEAAQ